MTVAIIAVLVALSLAASSEARAETMTFTIVDSGTARMSIVIPAGADPEIKAAADDLAACIERASGAKPVVTEENGQTTGPAIVIGQCRLATGTNSLRSELSYDAYVISPDGENIVIRGRTDQGTVYGVYGFLHDHLGARWYMPGKLWEVVPKADPLTVTIKASANEPSFPYRVWQAGWYSPDIKQWCTRNRITTYLFERPDSPYRSFDHNLYRIFPVSKYGKAHPEYYSQIDGKPFLPSSDKDPRGEPCFTSPEVIRVVVETVRQYFEDNPDASQYSLSVNDNLDFCTCPNCTALDSPYRTHRGTVQHSESYFHFVQRVAAEIEKSNPGKTLGCLAYWGVELPPRNIEKLPANVVVELTQDSSQHLDPKYRAADRKLFRQWSKVAGRLIQYDYYALGWLTPRYYPHLLSENLKWIHGNGAVGTYAEIYPHWATQNPMTYMASELAWNLKKKPDAILDQYFATLYGEAAPEMKEFYSILESIWMKPRAGQWFRGFLILEGESSIFDIEAMTEARGILRRAEKKSVGVVKERVKYVEDYFDFSYLIESGYDRAAHLNELPLDSASDFEKLAKESIGVMRLARLAEQTYGKTLKDDPIYLLGYKPSTDWYEFGIEYKLDQWEDKLALSVKQAILRMREWAGRQPDSEAAKLRIDRVMEDLSRIKTRKMVDPGSI